MPESATERIQPATTVGVASHSDYEDIELPTELFKGQDIKRSDTPETLLTEFSNRPDITMFCDQCGVYIDVKNLPYHRSFHEALTTMRYQLPHRPTDVVSLLHRRNTIIHRLKKEATEEEPLRTCDISKVNEAYELLKSDLEDIYEEMKQIHEKVDMDMQGVALNCSPACAQAIGMCNSNNNRWKSYMEDTKVYQDYFGEDRNKCYFAIFDGYHGISSAERCSHELHHLLLSEMSKFDPKTKSTMARNFADSASARTDYELLRPETRDSFRANIHQDSTEMVQGLLDMCYEKYDSMMKDKEKNGVEESSKQKKKKPKNPICEKMQKAFKKTYYLMDILLSYGKDETSRVRWSGTSALTLVIQNTKTPSADNAKDEKKLASLQEEELSGSGSESVKHSARSKEFEPLEELGLIHIANAGNTRGILVRGNKAYRLSKDHTPQDLKERNRVLSMGGNLSTSEKDCRINGVLSVTRGLGNHGDKKLKDCIIVDPHVTTVPIDQYAQFLVLASKGVWEVFSDDEVAALMLKLLPSEQIPLPIYINESVIELLENETNQRNDSMTDADLLQPQKLTSREGRVSFSDQGQDNESSAQSRDGQDSSRNKNHEGDCVETKSAEQEIDRLVIERNSQNVTTLADLRTEVGSRVSETDDDVSLETGTHCGLEEDFVSHPKHSDFRERQPVTVEEKSRELAKTMAETLVQAALMAKAKDNITVMIVLLPACTF